MATEEEMKQESIKLRTEISSKVYDVTLLQRKRGQAEVRRKVFEIIEEVREELCTSEGGFEEFERGAKIACNNIRLKLLDTIRGKQE